MNKKESAKLFALHLLEEQGYNGKWDEESIKTFISEKFGVKWCKPKYNAKYGASFKPDESRVTEYAIYAKNFEVLCENVMWNIHNGSWRKEN